MDSGTEAQLRDRLELKYLFVQLIGNLVKPGELYNDAYRRTIDETRNFVYHSSPENLHNRAKEVSRQLDKLIEDAIGLFPIKASTEEIAREFRELLKERGEEVYLAGVTFGWLDNLIDCTSLKLPSDLPHHARIGLWVHAGRHSIEEKFLLGDAFFLLELADASYGRMQLAASQLEAYPILSVANENVCSAARLCVFSFYAFVEAFVNSVGSDFAARNTSTLTSRQIEWLHGRKGRRFLSLEAKMECFPGIIRQDGKRPIVLTDKKQRTEPFLTFFSFIKDVRNASTHFGVGKESIWRKPEDWLRRAELASINSVEVASVFWEACYPRRDKPDYLDRLNYETLRGRAANRLGITRHILSLSQPAAQV